VVKAPAVLLCLPFAAGCSLGTFASGVLACGPDDGGPVCPSGTTCYCNLCSTEQPASCCVAQIASSGGLTPRYGLTVAYIVGATDGATDDYLFAMGGFDSCGEPSSLVEVYDVTDQSGWLPASGVTGTDDLPTAAGYLGATTLGSAGPLLVAGGEGPSDQLLSTVDLNPFPSPSWEVASNLPVPLAQPAVAYSLSDGCVYLVGGVLSSGPSPQQSSDIEQLCGATATATWVSLGGLSCDGSGAPCPISGAAAVYSPFDQNIYVLGGLSAGSALTSVETFAPGGTQSLFGMQPTSGHINGGAAAAGTSLYLMGGLQGPGQPPIDLVETIDLSSNAGWSTTGPQLPLPLSDFGTASDAAGNLYVVGGRTLGPDGGDQVVGSMAVFSNGVWTTVP
jgi:hypothetical protein